MPVPKKMCRPLLWGIEEIERYKEDLQAYGLSEDEASRFVKLDLKIRQRSLTESEENEFLSLAGRLPLICPDPSEDCEDIKSGKKPPRDVHEIMDRMHRMMEE